MKIFTNKKWEEFLFDIRNQKLDIIAESKAKIKNKERELKEAYQELDAKSAMIKDLKNQLCNFQKKERELKENYEKNINNQEHLNKELENKITHQTDLINSLKKLNKQLYGQKGGFKKANNNLKEEIEELNQRIKNQAEEMKKKHIQITPIQYEKNIKVRRK